MLAYLKSPYCAFVSVLKILVTALRFISRISQPYQAHPSQNIVIVSFWTMTWMPRVSRICGISRKAYM